jgi:hypothetical protein
MDQFFVANHYLSLSYPHRDYQISNWRLSLHLGIMGTLAWMGIHHVDAFVDSFYLLIPFVYVHVV